MRILDGGRAKWVAEGREMTTEQPKPTPVEYPVVERDDATIRAFKDDVLAHLGRPLVDVRSPGEYSGELLHMPDYPQEGAVRGGHIPGAASVPWARAAAEDATFKPRADLEAIYQQEQGLSPDDDVVAYCRIGERSSHTWFVLTHLLGFGHVRNYDGSWTEWGNSVRVPIVAGRGAGVCVTLPPAARRAGRGLLRRRPEGPAAAAAGALPGAARRSRSATPTPRRRWSRCTSASRRCSWRSRWSPDAERRVHLFFSAPPEAPTTRGFASIMRTGLDGEPAADVLAVPGRLLHRARACRRR